MKRGIYLAFITATLIGIASFALVATAFLYPQPFRDLLLQQKMPSWRVLANLTARSNAEIVSQANQAVVTVIASRAILNKRSPSEGEPDSSSENQIQRGTGTGFIIDPKGYIITNEHVVNDADRLRVKLADGRERKVVVLGADRATDLALLKIEADNLVSLALGDSDAARVGDQVIAIGNPLEYEHSVTAGIISAKGRKVYNSRPYEDFIQTDAAINRGNSGGPLLNRSGEVVGVNTVIRIDGRGISFAVPSNVVRRVAAQLRAYGFVPRGFLGLTPAEITAEFREGLGLGDIQGILVADVSPNLPASRAGIQPYDVITHFDGRPLDGIDDFFARVANSLPQQRVGLSLVRGGQVMNLYATLEPRPDNEKDRPQESPPALQKSGLSLGFTVSENSPETLRNLSLGTSVNAITGGVIVTEVDPLGPAADSRLTVGQIILEINRHPIQKLEDFQEITSRLRQGSALVLRVTSPHQKDQRLIALRVGEI